MDELIKLLNKRGIYITFKVLSLFDNFRADKHSFYQKLNEFSYYNSFLRIKNKLLESELLNISNHNKTAYYELTSKGKRMFFLLKELQKLLG
jgi:predicted transcriptional regulator